MFTLPPRDHTDSPARSAGFAILRDHVALYAAQFERCSVSGETVDPQPGTFSGGGLTSRLASPFKGVPSSRLW